MGKPNLYALPRPRQRVETRMFSDPLQPGVAVTLTLKAPDQVMTAQFADLANIYIEQHITGGMEDGARIEPAPMMIPGGGENAPVAVPLTPGLCRTLAMLVTMQVGPEADRYTAVDLVAVMDRMPHAFDRIADWAADLVQHGLEPGGESSEGNAPRAAASI
jgi:hypothetical protein